MQLYFGHGQGRNEKKTGLNYYGEKTKKRSSVEEVVCCRTAPTNFSISIAWLDTVWRGLCERYEYGLVAVPCYCMELWVKQCQAA